MPQTIDIKQSTIIDDSFTSQKIVQYKGKEFLRVNMESLADISALSNTQEKEIVSELDRLLKTIPWDLEKVITTMRDQFDESGYPKER